MSLILSVHPDPRLPTIKKKAHGLKVTRQNLKSTFNPLVAGLPKTPI